MANEDSDKGGTPIVTDPATGYARTATPAEERRIEADDGIVPDPSQQTTDRLWIMKQATLSLCLVLTSGALVAQAFWPAEPASAADSAILVAVIGILINAMMQNFGRRTS